MSFMLWSSWYVLSTLYSMSFSLWTKCLEAHSIWTPNYELHTINAKHTMNTRLFIDLKSVLFTKQHAWISLGITKKMIYQRWFTATEQPIRRMIAAAIQRALHAFILELLMLTELFVSHFNDCPSWIFYFWIQKQFSLLLWLGNVTWTGRKWDERLLWLAVSL